jgi:hypothetical protein
LKNIFQKLISCLCSPQEGSSFDLVPVQDGNSRGVKPHESQEAKTIVHPKEDEGGREGWAQMAEINKIGTKKKKGVELGSQRTINRGALEHWRS